MSHNSISRREIILLGLVLAVAVISGFFYKNKESPPSVIEKVQKNEVVQTTLDDCRQDIPLDKIDDSAVDLDRTATVYWYDDEAQKITSRKFKFEPKNDFEGCSESVKTKLREINEVAKETYGEEYEGLFIN